MKEGMDETKMGVLGTAILVFGVLLLFVNLLEFQIDFCGLTWAILLLAVGVRLLQVGLTGQRFTEDEPVSIALDEAKQAASSSSTWRVA